MNNDAFLTPAAFHIKSKTKRGKVVTAKDAIRIIRDGDIIVMDAFIGACSPDELINEIERCFLETGNPKDLSILIPSTSGDGNEKGMNRLSHEGLLKRVIAGHYGLTPKIGRLATEGKIEAYNFPQGVIANMLRDIAVKNPRTISRIGLGTFVDPRIGGGKVSLTATEDLVEVVEFDNREFLAYKTPSVNIALLRGTTSDLDGNITMEREALTLEAYYAAMAVKNSGGVVIVQVERIADRHSLDPRNVKIPGILVDCVVVAEPENHQQTYGVQYNPAYSCEMRVPVAGMPALKMDERKIIARRASFELRPNMVVNLGIGMPEGVAGVANEEGILDYLTLTAEAGSIGGIPASGKNFGAAVNMDCLVGMHNQFDFYDGGGLDLACLGSAQIDEHGNVNVSKFGPKLAGCGGFIDITQSSKTIIFAGTFTAGRTQVEIQDGKLKILKEGGIKKFVKSVEQITFSGKTARANNLKVLYVTERCVFSLVNEGLELVEIAPGIDIEKDILPFMEFKPIIDKPRLMDERIFNPKNMGLSDELLSIPIPDRMTYETETNILYINFEGLNVRTVQDIETIRTSVSAICEPLGKKVNTIVNYDNFSIVPELEDSYMNMVEGLYRLYYEHVTRYSTSVFLKMKIGDALKKRGYAPHVYESLEEARQALAKKS
jgi:propionate CoA-transferase